jgi:hypothetical protein
MKPLLTFILIAALQVNSALAAVPEVGSREGDLACVGLIDIGYQGAKQSGAPTDVQSALMGAYGMYLGRLSKEAKRGDHKEVEEVLGRLSLEEKNSAIAACMKNAAQIMEQHIRAPSGR